MTTKQIIKEALYALRKEKTIWIPDVVIDNGLKDASPRILACLVLKLAQEVAELREQQTNDYEKSIHEPPVSGI